MHADHVETQVQQDGQVTIPHVPLQAGDAVDVSMLVRATSAAGDQRYPLRGLSVSYREPTDPIATNAWESAA